MRNNSKFYFNNYCMKIINSNNDFTSDEHYNKESPLSQEPLYRYNVENCQINYIFEISDSKKYRRIKFKDCVFKKDVILKNISISENLIFWNCKFEKCVTFHDVTIKRKARFWETTFNELKIDNLRFEDLADFFKTKFKENTIFYKTDFLATTVFTASIFEKNLLFTYSKISDVLIFSRTKFLKGMDLSQAIITGKIKNSNSDFPNFEKKMDIDDDDNYRDSFEFNGQITLQNKRETFRILKKAAQDEGNQFKFLEYSKIENETYFEQLKPIWIKRFDNYIIFLLNKISNDHNMSWSRGILFTAIIGLLFFYTSLITTSLIEFGFDIELFSYYLGKYIFFLSPIHKIDLFEEEIATTGTIILDFLGRLFVGYGIYQTIQAFRKHKG